LKKIIYILFLTSLAIVSFAQNDNFNLKLTTGTSYMNFQGNSFMSSYVMPEFRYKFNDKLNFSTGILANVNYGSGFNVSKTENSLPINHKMYNSYLFAKGEYRVSSNMNLRGTTFLELNNQPKEQGSYFYNLGADFKITEKVFFSIDVNFAKINRTNTGFYDPFYMDIYNAFNNSVICFDRYRKMGK